MEAQEFIKKRPYLIWYTKNFDRLSEESIVEAVLNYGDFEDVILMKKYRGPGKIIKKAKRVFHHEFNEKTFRAQLAYFKDINYSEKIIYLRGFEVKDEVIRKELTKFSLKS